MAIARPLGRRNPTDDRHLLRYPLTTPLLPDKPTPVIAGANWYSAFDEPVWDARGRFWIVGNDTANLGYVRGGHAFCFKPDAVEDPMPWWEFYDQGAEGACVGFAISRAMSLLNRKRYWGFGLYHMAQAVDEWNDTPPEEGTSVRAGLDVLRDRGHVRVRRVRGGTRYYDPDPAEGIESNRWATNIPDAVAAMHSPRYLELGRAPFLNSWGKPGRWPEEDVWDVDGYPHITWMPLDTMDRLLREDGELAVIFDR